MELLAPLLFVTALLGWMTWRSWRSRTLMGMRAGGGDDRLWWFQFARLAGLLLLALVGAIAAWRAM
jgi:hypothetical protein